MFVLAGVAAIPMAIDGFTQMQHLESTATMRMLTGTPFGVLVGTFMAASFSTRPALFNLDPSSVILPSGSSFSMKSEEVIITGAAQ